MIEVSIVIFDVLNNGFLLPTVWYILFSTSDSVVYFVTLLVVI
jgi:hypothetical protein